MLLCPPNTAAAPRPKTALTCTTARQRLPLPLLPATEEVKMDPLFQTRLDLCTAEMVARGGLPCQG